MRSSKKSPVLPKPNYLQRINCVLDYIYADLKRPLQLVQLAELADLSPFHFHRVFQAMVGETPNEFVKRLRLERALYLMSFGKAKSMTTIALDCGFGSSSDFTRSFKQRYGVAPSKFDMQAWQDQHGQRIDEAAQQSPLKLAKPAPRANPDQFRVKVVELPSRSVAYIRVSNPYQGDAVVQAARRLVDWAESKDFADSQWLGYQFESPRVTALEHCHYCAAVEVDVEFKPKDEVGFYRFPKMTVAEVEMRGGIDLEIRLLQWLYGSWLPRSKYVPDDHPCFEAWIGKPFEHGYEHFELKIQLPIRES
ncbi:MAG: AraC family transcriptional regulator [Pirellulales bacterium]